jgi:alkyl hydroperoxide reductase subunit F
MTGVLVEDKQTKEKRTIAADGLFIEIGVIPNSSLIKDLVQVNEREEIIVDEMMMTSLPGLFAAGDVTNQPFKQIVIAVADGAKAALAVQQYIIHHT